jgi:acyl-CoA synthetase (AMP-forming)/AMP-acid ligase II
LSIHGDARAVIHTHRNITSSAQALADAMSASPADRVMCFLPLPHALGLALLHVHLHVGACIALEAQPLDPARMLARLHEHACTGLWATPHSLQVLLAHAPVQETALPHLRYIQQAGGRLSAAALADLHHALPGKQVYCIYSEPEASGAITLLPPAFADAKPASVGKPLPCVRVELLTPAGQVAQPGEVGQVVVDGPTIARGYWPETAQATGAIRQGRLFTGDLASLDSDGYLQIAGRAADQMKLGGAAVNAAQIEEIASMFPGMSEVAISSRQDEALGDVVILVAVHPRGEEVRQQLIDFCASKLPFSQRPREIYFRAQLPRDDSGALDRAALSEEIVAERPLPPFVEHIQASQQSLQA